MIQAVADAGGSIVAIAALVFVVVKQLQLFEDMQRVIENNTQVTDANQKSTDANTVAMGELRELIKDRILK